MIRLLTAALLGALFGAGLLVSGMTDPAKVLGFLDVAGAWNPQLAFVMGGAVLISAPAFWLAGRKPRALLGEPIDLPGTRPVTGRLIGGAALFGLGWGLAGICPGPGLVLVGLDGLPAWTFAAAVLAGGLLGELLLRRRPGA